ncbi:MAG: hypothetical protein HQL47_07220 [Gammaproteobacteria bacterium]|nr:hypothetical protein [Gammaproteobacteria bacterium]
MIDPALIDELAEGDAEVLMFVADPASGDFYYDPEAIAEMEAEAEALRSMLLEQVSADLERKRKEAIDGRAQSGIEQIWLEDEEAYEGIDDANRDEAVGSARVTKARYEVGTAETRSGQPGGSTVLLNITRPYVDAATARVGDMLLPTDDRNWTIKHTPIPFLKELKQMAPMNPEAAGLADQFAQIEQQAKEAAERAEKRIEDYHVECQYHMEVRRMIEDAGRLGTGILKGPFPKVDTNSGEVQPASKCISPWDFYPDPACGDDIQNGRFVFERELITAKRLRELRDEPGYLAEQIESCLKEGPAKRVVENDDDRPVKDSELFEMWTCHTEIAPDEMEACGCICSDEAAIEAERIPALITLVNDRVIRAAEDPLEGKSYPYDVMCWQRRRDHWAGIGVARQIRTPQRGITAAVRNLMDNAGLAGGPQILSRLGIVEPADGNWTLAPRKHWHIHEDADIRQLTEAFATVEFPMMEQQLLNIVQFFTKMAEDVTGLPQLMQGSQGKAPDTVGGMQMLNNNANTVLRRLARLFDDEITEPHIRRYYEWIKLYGEPEEQGDFSIDARGSTALVERDIQTQAIIQMGKLVGNPAFGIDPKKWITEWLKSQRLDPARYTMDEEQMAKMQQAMAQKQDPQMMVAQMRAQTEMQKEQLRQQSDMAELQFKAKEAERQRQFEMAMKERDLQMRAMEYAEKRGMELTRLKADLQKFTLGQRHDKEKFVNEIAVKNRFGHGI